MRKKEIANVICSVISGEHAERYGYVMAKRHGSRWIWDVATFERIADIPTQNENRGYFNTILRRISRKSILCWMADIRHIIEDDVKCHRSVSFVRFVRECEYIGDLLRIR